MRYQMLFIKIFLSISFIKDFLLIPFAKDFLATTDFDNKQTLITNRL